MNAPLITAFSDTVRNTTQVSASRFPSRDGIPVAFSGVIPRLWIVTSSNPTGQPPTAFADAPGANTSIARQVAMDATKRIKLRSLRKANSPFGSCGTDGTEAAHLPQWSAPTLPYS